MGCCTVRLEGSCGHFLGRSIVPEGLDSLAERKQGCLGLAHATQAKLLQSCLTLCDHRDCSPPGFSTHGIFQARVLEWGAIAFSRHLLQLAKTPQHLERAATAPPPALPPL